MKRYKNYLINLIIPGLVFGSVTGTLTAAVVLLYKLCANRVIAWSEAGYHFLRHNLIFVPVALCVLVAFALFFSAVYKRTPNVRGGGIPTAVGILRGLIPFRWIRNIVYVFCLSLCTFFVGVPLGNEGPSVQMGAAIGRGVMRPFKNHGAWDRYSMTGGACAGFSVATGAPISGIMFAVEEAHQRISPMIIIVSSTAVLFANLTTQVLAPLLGVGTALFPRLGLVSLSVGDVWMPLVVGTAVGLFSVLFLRFYRVVKATLCRLLARWPQWCRLLLIFVVTLIFGLCSYSFISTGHELMLSLFTLGTPAFMLLLIIVLRSVLTLSANSEGITGGMFLPILALGATLAAALGKGLISAGLSERYYTVLLVLGITACISGMMKMPLTAIFFAVEALAAYDNIIHIIAAAVTAFMITEIFGAKSINDTVLDDRVEQLHEGQSPKAIDAFVAVKTGSFAVGKQVRDIFWPANLFVLSVKHDDLHGAEVDEHGGRALREGDVLHVRYSTYDEFGTAEELIAIVGPQEYDPTEVDIV